MIEQYIDRMNIEEKCKEDYKAIAKTIAICDEIFANIERPLKLFGMKLQDRHMRPNHLRRFEVVIETTYGSLEAMHGELLSMNKKFLSDKLIDIISGEDIVARVKVEEAFGYMQIIYDISIWSEN